MRVNTTALLAGLALVMLSACQKAPEPKTSGADPTSGSSPAASPASPGGSVALPAEKTPPSDAAIPPVPSVPPTAQNKGNSGDANSPTQANPSALQKQQEQASMPQSGQVNNHSVPETTGTTK